MQEARSRLLLALHKTAGNKVLGNRLDSLPAGHKQNLHQERAAGGTGNYPNSPPTVRGTNVDEGGCGQALKLQYEVGQALINALRRIQSISPSPRRFGPCNCNIWLQQKQ